MSESDDDRSLGVDFGDLDGRLESHDYPADTDEIREAYGDAEIGLEGGSVRLDEALEGYQEEFQSADEVKQAVLNMVGSEAVGRENYSDRGDQSESDQEHDEESL
ncbi:DUF5789 family protein [Halomarina ordinaria]|uniref:DUF2795 domain-containing protein n=1 Tax=Halomarina ordinaria TaxID=3033939 RepID=A0ABD5U8X5_9EURY|nr:hypothetical protein [Halomarina sp. PSRA2]